MKSSTLVRRFLPYYRKYGKTVAIDLFCAALTLSLIHIYLDVQQQHFL